MDVIKDTKIGQGLKYLPRKLSDLVKGLHDLLEELAETGPTEVRKVAAVLEELLSRNGISLDNDTPPLKTIVSRKQNCIYY